MHVESSAEPGKAPKHAGQKKTYRAIAETYAFLPREAVTRFLMSCTECQKRMHFNSNGLEPKELWGSPLPKTLPALLITVLWRSSDFLQSDPWSLPLPGLSPACQSPAFPTELSLAELQMWAFHGTLLSDEFVSVIQDVLASPDQGILPSLLEHSWLTSGNQKRFLICGYAGKERPLLPPPKSTMPATFPSHPSQNQAKPGFIKENS
ncbi:uncharacterized protein LOC105304322 [Pteropus vampyrus]|uniref:Uncharacterized protein LOC105304322 n=1 Tax=Pteropus vampyrus TaxID=132908 RepID=A0A6P6BSV3_PTEVA|nr:uncharacterized protein LOC105304322 [Pteropus vampyrus]